MEDNKKKILLLDDDAVTASSETKRVAMIQLVSLIDNMQSGILFENQQRMVARTNQYLCDMFSIPVPPQQLVGADCRASAEVSKQMMRDPEGFIRRIDEVLEKGEIVQNDELQLKDGRTFERDYTPIKLDGELIGHLWQYRDITKRKNWEEALRKSEEEKSALINIIPDLFFLISSDGYILSYHTPSSEALLAPPEEFMGKSIREILPPDLADITMRSIKTALDTNRLVSFEYELLLQDSIRFYESRVVPATSGNVFTINRDITERKLFDKKMEKYTGELKALNATKDRLFTLLAHDLRNPFFGLVAISDELKDNYNNLSKAEITEFISIINTTSHKTFELLNNLLEWSRLQLDNVEFVQEKIGLYNEIENIMNLYTSTARIKSIEMLNGTDKDAVFFADRNMISTVLRNAVSNAIKFTPKGGRIVFRSARKNEYIEISVIDSGAGMTREVIEKVLRPDSRYTTKGTEGESGSGFGLLLCKELIEKNGGSLILKSAPGEGTEFSFLLPVSQR